MTRVLHSFGIVLALAWAQTSPAEPETLRPTAALGKASYDRHCAACHGREGRGDGDMANLLTVPPMDLTAIAKRRGGVFPAEEIAEIIDGRKRVRPHGSTEMPVWGGRLTEPRPIARRNESALRGEIIPLVAYLRTLQTDVDPTAESPEAETQQNMRVGEERFLRNCASCHGPGGTGDGYLGRLLAQRPTNLRTIAARNGGKFPTLSVAKKIDGRESVLAHGSRDMPVWGDRFRRLGGASRDAAVRGEVMLYVSYLRSIQEP